MLCMKVFISWSGQRSQFVALALRKWLPDVIQSLEPWMSDVDIEKGARWSAEIGQQLGDTKAGIICVTPENTSSPWLNFEAGALAKTIADTFVCPLLIDLKASDVTGPLTQFQMTQSAADDVEKLIATLNVAAGAKLQPDQLKRSFDRCWPQLEESLRSIPPTQTGKSSHRSPNEVLEEILSTVRGLRRDFSIQTDPGVPAFIARWSTLIQQARLVGLSDSEIKPIIQIFAKDHIRGILELEQLIQQKAMKMAEQFIPAGESPSNQK